MSDAKPWYLSKSLMAQLAAVILLIGTKFGLLPAELTNDQIVNFLLIAVPMIVGIVGRVTATHVLTGTKASAAKVGTMVALFGLMLLPLTLSACATVGTPAQSLYAAFSGYKIALGAAADYAVTPTADKTIVRRIDAANRAQDVQAAVSYAQTYVLCHGSAKTVAARVDCSIWDFRPTTASGYAITLRTVTTALLVRN